MTSRHINFDMRFITIFIVALHVASSLRGPSATNENNSASTSVMHDPKEQLIEVTSKEMLFLQPGLSPAKC